MNRNSSELRQKKFQSVVFRAEVSQRIGLGHMMRCLSFAESLPVPVIPYLVMRDCPGRDEITMPLVDKNWTIHTLPQDVDEKTDVSETVLLAKKLGAGLVVTDLGHRKILKHPSLLVEYHRALRAKGAPFVFSIEDCRMTGFASNAAVIPYNCNGVDLTRVALDGCRVMAGLKYYICHPQFIEARGMQRIIRDDAYRVLVSIGGSDPLGITAKVAQALALLSDRKIEGRILLGPTADFELLRKVNNVCLSTPGLTVLKFTHSMAELLLWADLAIVGDGLVKYEAAISGTPSLMISQFEHNSLALHSFRRLNCARYLGPAQGLREKDIANTVEEILADPEARVALSRAGKRALDGCGMERIFNEILKSVLEC